LRRMGVVGIEVLSRSVLAFGDWGRRMEFNGVGYTHIVLGIISMRTFLCKEGLGAVDV
jgi:hypothetical protein